MKIPRQISLKKATTIILVSVLLTVIGSYYAFAATPTSTFTISPGIYPGAPSYTIWKEGNTYFAKNSNGKIEFSGTNASQVINQAKVSGGVIFLKEATYTLTDSIDLTGYDNLSIVGEGRGTVLYLADGVNKPVIYAKESSGIVIKNLKIYGNKVGQTGGTGVSGIRFQGVTNFIIEKVWIENTYHQGIDIVDSSGTPSEYALISNVVIEGSGAAGIYIGFNCAYISISNVIAKNSGGGAGIDQDGLIIAGESSEKIHDIVVNNYLSIGNSRHGGSIWGNASNIIISNFQAINNAEQGFLIQANQERYIRDVQLSGVFKDNGYHGILVHPYGVIENLKISAITNENGKSGFVATVETTGLLKNLLLDIISCNNTLHGIQISCSEENRTFDITLRGIVKWNNQGDSGSYGVSLWKVNGCLLYTSPSPRDRG